MIILGEFRNQILEIPGKARDSYLLERKSITVWPGVPGIRTVLTRIKKLPLLSASCVRTAAQTIAVVISDTPGFYDETKINMSQSCLGKCFVCHMNRCNSRHRVAAGIVDCRKFMSMFPSSAKMLFSRLGAVLIVQETVW